MVEGLNVELIGGIVAHCILDDGWKALRVPAEERSETFLVGVNVCPSRFNGFGHGALHSDQNFVAVVRLGCDDKSTEARNHNSNGSGYTFDATFISVMESEASGSSSCAVGLRQLWLP
jgi:hypothetical protein